MLDIKLLRAQPELIAEKLKRRRYHFDVPAFLALDESRKHIQTQTQELQETRNRQSKMIGQAKAKGQDIGPLLKEVDDLGAQLKANTDELDRIQTALDDLIARLPNCPDDSVPDGAGEEDNVLLHTVGTPTQFTFTPKDHIALGEGMGGLDFETSAMLSGARFVVMRGALARLHRALIQFMLNVHTQEHGYTEMYVPYLVQEKCYFGVGQLPKFAEDFFHVKGDQGLSLISTSEVPLTNTVREQILSIDRLPIKMTAHTPCFRSEAGSYGKDTKGMFRQHQFEKVELVQIVHPDQSFQVLEQMREHAETILKRLKLPYRVVTLCTGDIGNSAAKTYDLEVWLPGQNRYREISSISNCVDFQARRMSARFRNPETDKTELVHTLNGSGVAAGRALIAVMENYQDEHGNIYVPEVLWPYMNNQTIIHKSLI